MSTAPLASFFRAASLGFCFLMLFAVRPAFGEDYVFTTVAGTPGGFGSSDGPGNSAQFSEPRSVAVDSNGNLFVADTYNHTIRKITAGGIVTTLAGSANSAGSTDGTGSNARFNFPRGIATDSLGNVFVADTGNHTIRKITASGE